MKKSSKKLIYQFSPFIELLRVYDVGCLKVMLGLMVFSQIVSALAVDNSGSRVLSGSYDYTVRMYDFQGMNSRLESFRQLEPFEGHQVRTLSWSSTSDRFLCVTGSAQAKVTSSVL